MHSYETPPQSGLLVNPGESKCFTIKFPNRGRLTKLVVMQYSGIPVHFDVDLFSNESACRLDSISDSEGDSVGPLSPELFRVCPTLRSQTAGELQEFFVNQNIWFFNQDGAAETIGDKQRIYVRITPNDDGDGEKAFALVLGCEVAATT